MFDLDVGLVVLWLQVVFGWLVDEGVVIGKLKFFVNMFVQLLIVEDGKIKGVKIYCGMIMVDYVVVCVGFWGCLIVNMVGEDFFVMLVDYLLIFFGLFNEFEGIGKDIGYLLFCDQGNLVYMCDMGDFKIIEGGQIEWGYYEIIYLCMCYLCDFQFKEEVWLLLFQWDLELEQVIEFFEWVMELILVLSEFGYNEIWFFNGFLQVFVVGGLFCGES